MRRYLGVAGAVWWRTIHNFVTRPAFILPSVIFPLFFFTAFAGGLSSVSNVPGFDFPSGYTAFQYCFVLLQASAFGGVFTGFGIASDFQSGFARRLLLAAPNRSAIVVGYAAVALTRAAIVVVILTVVALVVGMEIDGTASEIASMYLLAALVSLSAALFAAGVALRLRTIQAGPLMQMPVFLTLFLAPVYVPESLLQGWVSTVAPLNPITHVIETVRGGISGEPVGVGLAFGLGAAMVVGFGAWALRGLRRAERAGG